MKLIAHRGLFNGPNTVLENQPQQVELALSLGFDAEIDVWYDRDSGFTLGHDHPTYPVKLDWLDQAGLWIHAKNLDALALLSGKRNVFWHESDDHTLTSKGYVWSSPGKGTTSANGIQVMPEYCMSKHSIDFADVVLQPCFGICSDYVQQIKELL
jgi:hypothetical protein